MRSGAQPVVVVTVRPISLITLSRSGSRCCRERTARVAPFRCKIADKDAQSEEECEAEISVEFARFKKLIGAHAKFGKDNVTLGVGERGRGLFLSDKYLKTIAATKRAQSSSVKALKFGEQQARNWIKACQTQPTLETDDDDALALVIPSDLLLYVGEVKGDGADQGNRAVFPEFCKANLALRALLEQTDLPWETRLAVLLLHILNGCSAVAVICTDEKEAKNVATSFWKEYSALLPSRPEKEPADRFNIFDLEKIDKEQFLQSAWTRRRARAAQYESLFFEDFDWAIGIALSRAFSASDSDIALLCPFADMANHSADSQAYYSVSYGNTARSASVTSLSVTPWYSSQACALDVADERTRTVSDFQLYASNVLGPVHQEFTITYQSRFLNSEIMSSYGFIMAQNYEDDIRIVSNIVPHSLSRSLCDSPACNRLPECSRWLYAMAEASKSTDKQGSESFERLSAIVQSLTQAIKLTELKIEKTLDRQRGLQNIRQKIQDLDCISYTSFSTSPGEVSSANYILARDLNHILSQEECLVRFEQSTHVGLKNFMLRCKRTLQAIDL